MSVTAMSMRPLAGLFLVQNRTITSWLLLISRGNFGTAVSLLALNVSYACATGLNAVLPTGIALPALVISPVFKRSIISLIPCRKA